MDKKSAPPNYQNMLAELDRMIKQDPDNVEAYYRRSELFYSQENYNDGIKDLDVILERDSDAILAYMFRGYGYGKLGKDRPSN